MAFPTTGLLDAFTRANEDPLASGWLGPVRPAVNSARLVSNEVRQQVAGDGTTYFNTSYAADQEAWFLVNTLPGSGGSISLLGRIRDPGLGTDDFYQWTYTVGTGWRMFVVIDDAYTQLGSTVSTPAMSAGEKIGLELTTNSQKGYHYTAGSWSVITTTTDSQIATGGFIGIEMADATAAVDDFGGGNIGSGAGTPPTLRVMRSNLRW